jgi:hypothetical protein
MAGALQVNGAPSEKQPVKFTPIYTGRIFTGIWTNRSPLRDAASTRTEEKYYGPRGDAMIAGANVEVSNRLTLIRRPGNPIYDTANTYADITSFDEFRISKGLSDAFGTTLEEIELMVDTSTALYAEDSSLSQELVFTKTTGAGQSFMKQVGNQLYFGNGIDNKKWSQSLFMRTSLNNSTAINTDSYPFMDTFLIDNNDNVQQMIGTKISTVSNVVISGNILTLTVSNLGADQPLGTQFMLWGFSNAATTFLNGATITLNADYTSGGTTLTAAFTHADVSQADTAYVQIMSGGSPVTGGSVPTWGTTVPAAANKFQGSITLDGNVLWVNRGSATQNWGLKAPTDPLTFTASGSSVGWAKHTYYSPASIYSDPVKTAGYLWQVSTAGVTGSTEPAWPATPTPSTKIDIKNVSIAANVVSFTTEAQALAAGNVVDIELLDVATFLNGQQLTVLAGGLSATTFTAAFTHPNYTSAADRGLAIKAGTTQTDGLAVWTCIQTPASMVWAASTHYHEGDFLLNPVGTAQQYFFLRKNTQPFLNSAIVAYGWNSTTSGAFNKSYPGAVGTEDFTLAPQSLNWSNNPAQNVQFRTINGAGEVGADNDSGHYENWEAAITCQIYVPVAGTYTFTLSHDDGAFFSFDTSTGAYKTMGSFTDAFGHTKTAYKGYGSAASLCGNNNSGSNVDAATWVFPTAGNYGLEIDWTNWEHASTMLLKCGGQQIAITPDISGSNQPAWPAFTATGASWDSVNSQILFGASVQESAKQYTWSNIGPIGDFTWIAATDYTLPGTQIVDTNSNEEGAYETGATGLTAPVWSTSISAITADPNPNLTWINEGPVPNQASATGKITATSAQGWLYALALVNTLDNTVSNIGPVSLGTGPVIGGQITFDAGAGLPTDLTLIDSQADYVAIFRSTDGESTELLIPSNGNTFYTVPLTQYLQYGYVDTTPDTGLDTLVQAAAAGENTPPLPGAVNLTFHLNRIWYSVGNTVFYTTGPLAPVGNGINGTAPLNYDKMPSLVKRLVPTTIGMLVFTVSDIYIIQTSGGNIYPGLPYAPGIGISSYNALDINGPEIGFFTTDHQFLIFSPSAGGDQASIALADQFRKNNGQAGSDWNPKNVFVAHYASGDDMGWFVADGSKGWYKLIPTPAPDGPGHCWSPFAVIANGVKAIKSVETSPGVHALVLGPTGSGKIRQRDVDATTDGGSTGGNGTAYAAYTVFGSYVLAQPGQVAQVAFITTDSVNVGSPLIVGVLIDEALPYYDGSFEMIKVWETDPPGLPKSKSILGQRFYLSETQEPAACRHMQLMVQWPAEAAANELQSFTIFGCFIQEA